ncbi:MAG: YciI family protein [Cyanobacteria bacterium P01_E01_bin.6]
MPKYVAWGEYCENVLEKRAPYRQDHLDGLKSQKESGVLVTIGPTQDLSMFFAIYDADSEDVVNKLIEGDPYWQNGIWTEYTIKEWIQAL